MKRIVIIKLTFPLSLPKACIDDAIQRFFNQLKHILGGVGIIVSEEIKDE